MPHVEYQSESEYRSADAINQSSLKVFAESPQAYYSEYIAKSVPPRQPTREMRFGIAVENFLRTGGMHNYIRLPEHIKVRRGKAWEDYRDSLPPGTQVLTQTEWEEIGMDSMQRIMENVREHAIARTLLDHATWHRRIGWETTSGDQCKAEIDITVHRPRGRILCDVKTTSDCTPAAFARQMCNLGYDIQAAWYSWGDQIVTGLDSEFVFLVINNSFPYDVETYTPSQEFMQLGMSRASKLLAQVTHARETGIYRTPTWGKVAVISPPSWAISSER